LPSATRSGAASSVTGVLVAAPGTAFSGGATDDAVALAEAKGCG
jgi:hypothetical protein